MIYTPLTKKALKLCFEAHKNQVDKTGLPYVFHPFHLAEQMDSEIAVGCALLHDVVEDTPLSLQDIAEMGFPREAVEVLALLTHEEGAPYMEYVQKIKHNPIARQVKIADLQHNSDLTRLDTVDEWAQRRNAKYSEALRILTE